MQIKELAEKLGWKLLCGGEGETNEVTGCYLGDLLSWVMGRARQGDVWITVMGNVNAVAVAVLTDAAAIVLADNAALDDEAKARAESQGVPIYSTEQNIYDSAVAVHGILPHE